MRTAEEIVNRIKGIEPEAFFGFQADDLMRFLPFEDAKQFLNAEGVKEFENGKWNQEPLTREGVIKIMGEYMDFALSKASDHRGLSAGRSIEHYKAWVWLLGDEDYKAIDWENYTNYGVPVLRRICEKYKIYFPESSELSRMSKGLSCREGCDEGCGKD